MRIVFLGTPECVLHPLKYLVEESSHEVVAVVSQPSKKKGRGQKFSGSPVTQYAIEKGLTHFEPLKASSKEFLDELAALKPDLCLTCAYGKILTTKFLQIPKRGTINIHPSKLPHYRGATPVPAALLDGLNQTSISVLFTVKALDAGNIIVQTPAAIDPKEKADELLERLFRESVEPLKEALLKLENPSFEGTPQDEAQMTECSKIEKEDGLVDWTKKAQDIFNRYRAFSPWPGTFTFFKNKRIVFTQVDFEHGEQKLKPGQLCFDNKSKTILVGTGSTALTIHKLKPEGKKEIAATDFWNQVPKSERSSVAFDSRDEHDS